MEDPLSLQLIRTLGQARQEAPADLVDRVLSHVDRNSGFYASLWRQACRLVHFKETIALQEAYGTFYEILRERGLFADHQSLPDDCLDEQRESFVRQHIQRVFWATAKILQKERRSDRVPARDGMMKRVEPEDSDQGYGLPPVRPLEKRLDDFIGIILPLLALNKELNNQEKVGFALLYGYLKKSGRCDKLIRHYLSAIWPQDPETRQLQLEECHRLAEARLRRNRNFEKDINLQVEKIESLKQRQKKTLRGEESARLQEIIEKRMGRLAKLRERLARERAPGLGSWLLPLTYKDLWALFAVDGKPDPESWARTGNRFRQKLLLALQGTGLDGNAPEPGRL